MKEAKVVFLNRSDPAMRETFWEHVPPGFKVVWLEAQTATDDEITQQMRDADFLMLTRAKVPEAEVLRYSTDLRSMTGGRGTYELKFSHFDEVPEHVAQGLIAAYEKARAAGE